MRYHRRPSGLYAPEEELTIPRLEIKGLREWMDAASIGTLVGAKPPAAWTNYTADADIVAYYMFETSPGLSQSGTGDNHVDDAGNLPDVDTSIYKQGAQSALFVAANTDYMVCLHANMTADFPGKDPSDSFTVVAWIYPVTSPSGKVICSNWSEVWRFIISGGVHLFAGLVYSDGGGGTVNSEASTVVGTGAWYHAALVLNGTDNKIYLYLNGALDNGTGTAFDHTLKDGSISDFGIGAYPYGGNYLDGRIDELAVFKRALSSTEINEIIAHGLAGDR